MGNSPTQTDTRNARRPVVDPRLPIGCIRWDMGRLIVKTISLFGRYSVLLLLPPIVLAVWGWLLMLDDHTLVALILAVP